MKGKKIKDAYLEEYTTKHLILVTLEGWDCEKWAFTFYFTPLDCIFFPSHYKTFNLQYKIIEGASCF